MFHHRPTDSIAYHVAPTEFEDILDSHSNIIPRLTALHLVMLDSYLAKIYGMETKVLKQDAKRNANSRWSKYHHQPWNGYHALLPATVQPLSA